MSETLHEWIQEAVIKVGNDYHTITEEQLRLVVRDRPRYLPDRLWRWALRRLLVLERNGHTEAIPNP